MKMIMTGYIGMGYQQTQFVLKDKFEGERFSITPDDIINITNPLHYTIVAGEPPVIVVTTPVQAEELATFMEYLKEHKLDTYHVVAGVEGKGVTERHIITAWIPAGNEPIQVYDSKISDPVKFFSPEMMETKPLQIIVGIFRSLVPRYKSTTTIRIDGVDRVIKYNTLGTQSFFDPASCGYHTAVNIQKVANLLQTGQEINSNILLSYKNNPVKEIAALLKEDASHAKRVDSDFSAFMKKAWQDTFMTVKKNEEKERPFSNYFLGWPDKSDYVNKTATVDKIIYFASLRFVFQPLFSILKLPTELVANVLSETASYLKNNLIAWAPKSTFTQYSRSLLLLTAYAFQGIFKGISYAFKPFTSPMSIINPVWKAWLSIDNAINRRIQQGIDSVIKVTREPDYPRSVVSNAAAAVSTLPPVKSRSYVQDDKGKEKERDAIGNNFVVLAEDSVQAIKSTADGSDLEEDWASINPKGR